MRRWEYDIAIELGNKTFVSKGETTSNDGEDEQSITRALVMVMVANDPKLNAGRLVRSNVAEIR